MEIEDIHEPLAHFENVLKPEHEKNVQDHFNELVVRSGVDQVANAQLVREISSLENEVESANSNAAGWNFLRCFLVLIIIVGIVCFIFFTQDYLIAGVSAVVSLISLLLIFKWLNPKIKAYKELSSALEVTCKGKKDEAWGQMSMLNALFQWDTLVNLFQKTCPNLSFDPYFSEDRFQDLVQNYDWQSLVEQGNRSVLFCQSGEIKKNPFLISDILIQEMGMKTYFGHLGISWQEQETYTDDDGKEQTHWVTKTETLTASLDKPIPTYRRVKILEYAHEACPDLSFSRGVSDLSDDGQGFFDRRKLKNAIEDLHEKSRELSGFTIMSNHEFDALFSATNRNHPIQFRVMFTPMAQQQMLTLLRDQKIGYGDNFTFIKNNKQNIIVPKHLESIDISGDPVAFHHYDFASIQHRFTTGANEYFKALYFAFAPLLSIPVYQEKRSLPRQTDSQKEGMSSLFECEAIANDLSTKQNLKHAQSITQNILKTRRGAPQENGTEIIVTAHGFRGQNHTEYISVYGGDGRNHRVPVEWVEYIPVAKDTSILINETLPDAEASEDDNRWQGFRRRIRHRSIWAFMK